MQDKMINFIQYEDITINIQPNTVLSKSFKNGNNVFNMDLM